MIPRQDHAIGSHAHFGCGSLSWRACYLGRLAKKSSCLASRDGELEVDVEPAGISLSDQLCKVALAGLPAAVAPPEPELGGGEVQLGAGGIDVGGEDVQGQGGVGRCTEPGHDLQHAESTVRGGEDAGSRGPDIPVLPFF